MNTERQGCLARLLAWLRPRQTAGAQDPRAGLQAHEPPPVSPAEALPYRLRDDFLSPAEASFFRVLRTIVADRFLICPKVALGDLFFVPNARENVAAGNRIARKHVDFLLCEPATLRPRLGIELDDRSHQRLDRAARDDFVDRVFAAAGLPLVHVALRRSYTTREVEALLLAALQGAGEAAGDPAPGDGPLPGGLGSAGAPPIGGAPLCPTCGVPMVVRTAQSGANKGNRFYGCVNFPRCREMAPLGAS
ncbi:MAG: DUF2726 domain-containing protein [Ardenticatenaceae bacterium]|nr:DUF2726 domain-containing protein [Ardenticatenaceae bacterium]